ncbi:methyl-accepting chemotaxis protein [Malaciobacter marinus]|uniref:methyl-accepting chemotaxis protein n=1 Tax=Malaciobacter marinus TaxID=505249 RepID=UPI003AFFFBD8
MSIKQKLVLLSTCVLLGLIALFILNNYSQNQMKELVKAQKSVEVLKTLQTELRKNEKDFLARKDEKYLNDFQNNFKSLQNSANSLKDILKEVDISTEYTNEFLEISNKYYDIFTQIANTQKQIGLTHTDGLYGNLRKSVHNVQEFARNSNNFELLSLVYELRKEEKDFMLRLDEKYSTRFEKKIDSLTAMSINQEIKTYLNQYKTAFLQLVEKEKVKGLNEKTGLLENLRKTIYQTENSLNKMEKNISAHIVKAESFLNTFLIILTLLIIVVLMVSFYFISKSITKSINKFQEGLIGFFKYLNNETKDVALLDDSRNDEISNMSKLINKNIEKTKNNIEEDKALILDVTQVATKIKEGHLNKQITASTSNESLNALKDVINEMLVGLNKNISSISTVLKEFSNYKFTSKVDSSGVEGDMKEFIENVNFLTDEISGLLKDSLIIGLTLDEASDKLITNVDVLNTSSNEAAASLEETAAALEEITSTIVNNSENVAKMSKYAQELSNSAKTGQNLASKTTKSMEEINEQVSSINEAITVIDQIAFQTNILSLNAAVEAATAGEAGKGFAVVAAEVRNLANRSAEAAKSIKEIVENATSKANEGKGISSEMIKGYDVLLENIENSTQMISEIAAASKEQESGITQINDAVTQLDQQTQKNASIATQTHDIAIQTDTIAKEIVSDAGAKEFLGKEQAKVKKIDVPHEEEPKAKYDKKEEYEDKPRENKKSYSYEKKPKQAQTFTSNSSSDDEWESF